MNEFGTVSFNSKKKTSELLFAKNMYNEIPDLKPEVVDMFTGKDKKWKKIPIKEKLLEKPKESIVIPNKPTKGKAMAWPAYYKNPRLAPNKSGLGELAYMAHERLQASPLVKVRPEIKERLDRCQEVLDSNKQTSHLQIVVVDGYRKLKDQKILFETYKNWLKSKKPELDEEELNIEAQKMVSIPPKDKETLQLSPPPHSTGGSIDVILVDKSKIDITKDDWVQNAMINFGSDFDEMMHPEFGDTRSETRFFKGTNTEAEKNRNLLYNLLTQVGGFTNYHAEWWHFDYGNQFYAACKGIKEAEYGFIGGVRNDNEICDDNSAEKTVFEQYKKRVGAVVAEKYIEDFGVEAA